MELNRRGWGITKLINFKDACKNPSAAMVASDQKGLPRSEEYPYYRVNNPAARWRTSCPGFLREGEERKVLPASASAAQSLRRRPLSSLLFDQNDAPRCRRRGVSRFRRFWVTAV